MEKSGKEKEEPTGSLADKLKKSAAQKRTMSRFARTNAAQRKREVRVISEQSVTDALQSVDSREQALDDYLTRTLLKKRLVDILRDLVNLDFLPKNPYEFIIPSIREQEIQAELAGRRVTGLLNRIMPSLPASQYITNIRDNFDHFGSPILLKQIDVDALDDLNEALRGPSGVMVDYVTGEFGGKGKEPHVKAFTCLCAPTIFYGNILPYIDTICLNHDYFVTAKKFDEACKSFANEVIRNIFDFKNGGNTISSGVYVVQAPKTRDGVGEPKLWNYHEIQTSRQSFIKNVKDAVTGHRAIYVKGMVWLTLGANHGFVKAAAKLAAQNAQGDSSKEDDGAKKKKIVGKSLLARAALKQQEAQTAQIKREAKKRAQGCFYSVRKKYIFHFKDATSTDDDEKKTNQNSAIGFKLMGKYKYEALATGVYEKRQHAEFYASAWGGPKPGEQSYNSLIKQLKHDLIQEIAHCHNDGDWVAMYEKLLLIIVWNEGSEAALLSQIFNSMVGIMRQLSIEARTMRDVLSRCLKSSDELSKFSSLLLKQYSVFYLRVSKLIGGTAIAESLEASSGGASSSILASLKLMMRSRLARTVDESSKRLKLEASSVRNLDALSRTFRVIELSIAADAIPLFQGVQNLVAKTVRMANKTAAGKNKEIGKGKASAVDKERAKKQKKKAQEKENEEQHRMVIDVAAETRKYRSSNKFPTKVLREATVMQFLVDARVDTTIEHMYQQLLSEPLYPNPYPKVTIILQSAWARQEFWQRSDKDMVSELSSAQAMLATKDPLYRLEDGDSMSNTEGKENIHSGLPYTYIIRGGDQSAVWGTLASVRIADPKNLCMLYKCLGELKNRTDVSQHVRGNKEQICTGLAGRTALEFRISSHDESLPSFIECHEHYIITGPQARTAIRLFVEHVIKYAQWLHMDTPHLVTILSTGQIDPNTGNTGTRANFSVSDLKKGSAAIRRELIRAANNSDGVFLHGLMRLDKPYSQRFVLLRKWFFFHWRDPSTGHSLEKQSYLTPNSLQQAVFFSLKEAQSVISAIQEKLSEGNRDPMSQQNVGEYVAILKRNIGKKVSEGDMLDAYHEMVPLAVVENRVDQLCDLMRMLTSTAELVRDATFENRVLQELITGFSQSNEDDSFKGKVSLSFVNGQVAAHRERCKTILTQSGNTFVAGAQVEILATIDKIAHVVGSSDKSRVHEALVAMKETQSVLVALAAIVAYAIHNNCGHINEDMKLFVDLIKFDRRRK